MARLSPQQVEAELQRVFGYTQGDYTYQWGLLDGVDDPELRAELAQYLAAWYWQPHISANALDEFPAGVGWQSVDALDAYLERVEISAVLRRAK